jgi:rare lipoprotein A
MQSPPSAAGPIAQSQTPPPPAVPSPSTDAALTYPNRLADEKPPVEALKSKPEPKEPAETPRAPAVAATPPAAPPTSAASAVSTTPAPAPAAGQTARAGTWAVQVVALNDRAAANAVVERLSGKGYPAYLVSPQPGAPVQRYKVQVGRYSDRAEADVIAGRLQKEEQFQTWITR